MTTSRASTCAFVSSTEKGCVCLHIANGNMTSSINLTPAEGARLIADLQKTIDKMPRVASAADLGMAA